LNSCTFTGRLAADAEIKHAANGTVLCSFRIASDSGWGDNKKTHWISCVLFGDRGQALSQYLRKGDPVTVVGELEPPRLYEAGGETRAGQSLVVREVALQGGKREEGTAPSAGANAGGGGGYGQGRGSQGPSRTPQGATGMHPFDDDIPF